MYRTSDLDSNVAHLEAAVAARESALRALRRRRRLLAGGAGGEAALDVASAALRHTTVIGAWLAAAAWFFTRGMWGYFAAFGLVAVIATAVALVRRRRHGRAAPSDEA